MKKQIKTSKGWLDIDQISNVLDIRFVEYVEQEQDVEIEKLEYCSSEEEVEEKINELCDMVNKFIKDK